MILLHRLSGEELHLNSDLVESIEQSADTVIILVDRRRLHVLESPDEIVNLIREFRATVIVAANDVRSRHASQPPRLRVIEDEDGRVDVTILVGFAIVMLGITLSMFIDGNDFSPLIGPSAFLLVTAATVGATVMSYRGTDLRPVVPAIRQAVTPRVPDVQRRITTLARLAERARRDGMLSLESQVDDDEERLIHRGVEMLVDGADEDAIRETLQIEIASTDERHRLPISLLRTMASYAPTFGMVGTIIGLINMLGNLQDPAQLGIGLALALLTTFYGVLLANLLFNPVASRLERLNESELAALDLTIDGVLAIHRGMAPRALVERLETYLPPGERIGAAQRLAGPATLSEDGADEDQAA